MININIKQVLLIVAVTIVLSFFRYLMLDDYDLLKKNKLEQIDTKIKDLYKYVEYTDSPKLVDLNTAKLLYDNNIVTFIDARDLSDYREKHIKGAISLPYESIELMEEEYDLSYLLEIRENFFENIVQKGAPKITLGMEDGVFYMGDSSEIDAMTGDRSYLKKHTAFLIYCSGEGCSLSEDLGFYLYEQFNVRKIFIYEGGILEWVNSNFPVSR